MAHPLEGCWHKWHSNADGINHEILLCGIYAEDIPHKAKPHIHKVYVALFSKKQLMSSEGLLK